MVANQYPSEIFACSGVTWHGDLSVCLLHPVRYHGRSSRVRMFSLVFHVSNIVGLELPYFEFFVLVTSLLPFVIRCRLAGSGDGIRDPVVRALPVGYSTGGRGAGC